MYTIHQPPGSQPRPLPNNKPPYWNHPLPEHYFLMGDTMGQKTILYFEHELPLSCSVADRLTCDGYRVQMLDDAVRVLRMAGMLPPSLIILNMDMLGQESGEMIDQ